MTRATALIQQNDVHGQSRGRLSPALPQDLSLRRAQFQSLQRLLQASSLSGLKEIGCKSAWTVQISPLFWSIEQLLTCKTVKICPRPAEFSLRFFKPDRLLEGWILNSLCKFLMIKPDGGTVPKGRVMRELLEAPFSQIHRAFISQSTAEAWASIFDTCCEQNPGYCVAAGRFSPVEGSIAVGRLQQVGAILNQ